MTEQKSKWRHIGEEEALAHELYGVSGWLLLFAIGCFLGLLADFGSANGDARSIGMSLGDYLSISHPSINALKIILFYEVVAVVCIYWMMFAKSGGFRNYTSWLLLSMFPLMVVVNAANSYEGVGSVLTAGFIRWAISCAVWVSYLQLSKRVRLTFEHCVTNETEVTSEPKPAATGLINPKTSTSAVVAGIETSTTQNLNELEEQFWAIALTECNQQNVRPGLWAKAFADAQGQEAVAKAQYMRSRVAQLQAEHNLIEEMKLAEQEKVRQAQEAEQKAFEAEQAAALAEMTEADRLEALKPKGRCPNCSDVINLDSVSCPHCKADFSSGSSWSIKPLRGRELQANRAIQQAAHSLKPKLKEEYDDGSPSLMIFLIAVVLFITLMAINQ